MPFLYTTDAAHFHRALYARLIQHALRSTPTPDQLSPLFFLYTSPQVAEAYPTQSAWMHELEASAHMGGYNLKLNWKHEEVHLLRDVLRFNIPANLSPRSCLVRPAPQLRTR